MRRRDFIRKSAVAVAAASIAPQMVKASDSFGASPVPADRVDDFEFVSDEVRDGVRFVTAKTSAKVCSDHIDLEIRQEDNVLLSYVCNRGCPGNSLGLGRLVKGMKVDEVISKLSGTLCSNRGTSCPDQLARILAALPKVK